MPPNVHAAIDAVYRSDWGRIVAALIRVTGDFDVAEDSAQEAFAAAVDQWPTSGIPESPIAWILQTARHKAIDRIRRQARLDEKLKSFATTGPVSDFAEPDFDTTGPVSDFAEPDFDTNEIRDAGIPYHVPSAADLPERLASVLQVTYLVFNEGYAASSGASLTRHDLSDEAIRLGRLIVELLPDGEAIGLLALMLLSESRREARTSSTGDVILLEDQDRSLWNQAQIREGKSQLERALKLPPVGPYTIQAAIAAVHADAASAAAKEWHQIVEMYDALLRIEPSPVVALNQAVAVAMRDGSEAGLDLIDDILANGDLADYHLAHAARADLCRRLGRKADARESYERALALAQQEPERRFLHKRLQELA